MEGVIDLKDGGAADVARRGGAAEGGRVGVVVVELTLEEGTGECTGCWYGVGDVGEVALDLGEVGVTDGERAGEEYPLCNDALGCLRNESGYVELTLKRPSSDRRLWHS